MTFSPRSLVPLALVALTACASEGNSSREDLGSVEVGVARLERVDSLFSVGPPYSGLIARFDASSIRDIDPLLPVDVHLYAKSRSTAFGPVKWVFDPDRPFAERRTTAAGLSDEEEAIKGQIAIEASPKHPMAIQVFGPESESVDVYYSQGSEMAFCIEAKLTARRCRESGATDCDSVLATRMEDRADTCGAIDVPR